MDDDAARTYLRRMRATFAVGATTVLAAALSGCGGNSQQPLVLPAAETFTWTGGQPISFSPTPAGWKRSRYQNGGTEGVDFVKAGEQILIAERFFVGDRDRCQRLQEMLRDLDNYDPLTFARLLQRTKLYASEPFNSEEQRMIEVVNTTLDRAGQAYRDDEMFTVRRELSLALEQVGRIRYTIDETVDSVLFTAEKNQVYPKLEVEEPTTGELAGEPIVEVHFRFESHGDFFVGRRIYLVHNNRMFELGYQGREENLPLFERILESVNFPAGPCEH
jgi:hypothetical protein